MKRIICSLIIAGLTSACAGTPFSFDKARQVKVGMSEQQLTALMGPPYSVVTRGDEQIWVWSHANGLTGSSQVISYVMKEGKVISVPKIPDSFK